MANLDFARRSDLRLLAKSLRQGWAVEPEVKRQARAAVDAILADPGARDDLREMAGQVSRLLDGAPKAGAIRAPR